MPGPLLHVGATAICPHAGPVSVVPGNTRVLVASMPVATVADAFAIAGCAFTTSAGPHPCAAVHWLAPATRVFVNGQPAVLATSAGICQAADLAAQGPPVVISAQPKVVGA
jgi:uncharacterized Zn-binding protein involved in type VI secretion